jgi:hypothetical protein
VSASTVAPPTKTRRSTRPKAGGKSLHIPSLSFVTDQRGRKPFRCWFDVPPEAYWAGHVTGARIYQELIAYVRSGTVPEVRARIDLQCVIIDAAKIVTSEHRPTSKSREFAADQFLHAHSTDRGHPFQADRGQRSMRSRTP